MGTSPRPPVVSVLPVAPRPRGLCKALLPSAQRARTPGSSSGDSCRKSPQPRTAGPPPASRTRGTAKRGSVFAPRLHQLRSSRLPGADPNSPPGPRSDPAPRRSSSRRTCLELQAGPGEPAVRFCPLRGPRRSSPRSAPLGAVPSVTGTLDLLPQAVNLSPRMATPSLLAFTAPLLPRLSSRCFGHALCWLVEGRRKGKRETPAPALRARMSRACVHGQGPRHSARAARFCFLPRDLELTVALQETYLAWRLPLRTCFTDTLNKVMTFGLHLVSSLP